MDLSFLFFSRYLLLHCLLRLNEVTAIEAMGTTAVVVPAGPAWLYLARSPAWPSCRSVADRYMLIRIMSARFIRHSRSISSSSLHRTSRRSMRLGVGTTVAQVPCITPIHRHARRGGKRCQPDRKSTRANRRFRDAIQNFAEKLLRWHPESGCIGMAATTITRGNGGDVERFAL